MVAPKKLSAERLTSQSSDLFLQIAVRKESHLSEVNRPTLIMRLWRVNCKNISVHMSNLRCLLMSLSGLCARSVRLKETVNHAHPGPPSLLQRPAPPRSIAGNVGRKELEVDPFKLNIKSSLSIRANVIELEIS